MATATIRIAGVEKTVEIRPFEGRAHVCGLAAVIGRGSKRYPTTLTLWKVTDAQPYLRGNGRTIDTDGVQWQFGFGTCVRNQQARIVGWADVVGIDNQVNQIRA